MKKRLLFFSGITLASTAFAFPNPSAFRSSYIEAEESLLRSSLNTESVGAVSALRKDILDVVLQDKKDLIDEDFDIPEYFKASTLFWFAVYSQYSSQQVLIHDKEDLSLLYTVMDFEQLHNSKVNQFAKSKLQADLALERANQIKRILGGLHRDSDKFDAEERSVFASIKKAGLRIPAKESEKKKFFKMLAGRIRTQTGQRDMVHAGVLRSLPFIPFLERQFKNFKIPRELLAIAFVESSFNLKAKSYAGASGIWQFMPRTAASFLPMRTKAVDYRANPVISSLAAMHLLKQNKQILKRWDLAVPAYNFGTSHLVKAKRKYKDKASLAYILENYEHHDVGFASKNYYAEFLAMARVLAYKDLIFPLQGYEKQGIKPENIHVYISKCPIKPQNFFSKMVKSSPEIKKLNSHFLQRSFKFPKHKLLVSDLNLTSKRYLKLSDRDLLKFFPKNLHKLGKNTKCGK